MKIGIIGLGDMGQMYAKKYAETGFEVNGCDLPEKRDGLEEKLKGTGIHILDDGIAVSMKSDVIFYCVEAENIADAVRRYGHATRPGAIVAGQTSVKTPEINAFEEYLPDNVHINTCHSLHGPKVNPKGQTLVAIRHRSSDKDYDLFIQVLEVLGSNIVEIPSYKEHDRITADTQVNTHLGFLSMGTAWKNVGKFPWENTSYVGGIDNVKILMTLRMYGGKSHVYGGLAIMNPYAQEQIRQYARSVSDLFKSMIHKDEAKFRKRIMKAKDYVFGDLSSAIMLDDSIMGEYSLGNKKDRTPNSHLSLFGMVDAWHKLGINPYKNLICQTPPFRLRLGIVEYLFQNKELLEESIKAALFDKSIRRDDLEFDTAVNIWASIIEHGDMKGYKQKFENTREFFKGRIPDGIKKSDELIQRLASSG
ncbi:MAG TPA: prephenate dehydrogenase [Candidatus Nanoarchaeia archaeon]|nr:prephenate dehydrogenase [Candidatus Nanoarchaeia archaeon]